MATSFVSDLLDGRGPQQKPMDQKLGPVPFDSYADGLIVRCNCHPCGGLSAWEDDTAGRLPETFLTCRFSWPFGKLWSAPRSIGYPPRGIVRKTGTSVRPDLVQESLMFPLAPQDPAPRCDSSQGRPKTPRTGPSGGPGKRTAWAFRSQSGANRRDSLKAI